MANPTSSAAEIRGDLFNVDSKNGIRINGWVISSQRKPIASEADRTRIMAAIGLNHLPDMTYGDNVVTLQHEGSGFNASFCASDAIARCAKEANSSVDSIQVVAAQHWAQRPLHPEAKKLDFSHDWTFSTDYQGTYEQLVKFRESKDQALDINLLKRPDPILYFDEVPLFEDELHDNGTSAFSVKLRVMPTCFLVLARFFLRVDGVVFRMLDTRLFHDFSKTFVLRDLTVREEKYDTVYQKMAPCDPAALSDPFKVSEKMKVLHHATERFDLR